MATTAIYSMCICFVLTTHLKKYNLNLCESYVCLGISICISPASWYARAGKLWCMPSIITHRYLQNTVFGGHQDTTKAKLFEMYVIFGKMRWFGKVCNYHCPCVLFSILSVSPCPAIGNLPIKQGHKGLVLHCPVVLLAFFFC